MTNEDIIKGLTRMRKNFDPNSVYGSYCIDCLDAAIEALKEQPEHSQNTSSKQPDLNTFGMKTGETCEDVISRQDAIDVLDVLCQEHRYKIPGKKETYSQYNEAWQDALDRAEGAIFNLPSAQPETSTEIQEILNYLDTTLHPIVSPDNWYVYAELHDMVSMLPSAQQWIPCSKRLPEKSGQYYVSGGGKAWICKFLTIPNFAGGWCNNVSNPAVQAWTPLPEEPYKGES